MNRDNESRRGVSGADLLQTLFIGLKLAKIIDWSWWWVLSPLWINLIIVIVIGAVFILLDK